MTASHLVDSASPFEISDKHNCPTYRPAQILWERGEGVHMIDVDGVSYLDFVAGIAVNALGHGHPGLVAAVSEQAAKLMHVSNMFVNQPQLELLQRLTDHSFADRVFLCNSGTESTEAAMKLARRYQKMVAEQDDKFTILSMNKSFHGRTLASITATGQPKYHKGFEPLPAGHAYADFNDIESTVSKINDGTCAVIVEPVQGEGGVRPGTTEFLQAVREACDRHGALLIFDEVQTGVGRTGKLFGYENSGVEPDIMCLAKGLGGGFPIGATLATDKVFAGFVRGSHASTFGGNPMACAAANVVIETVRSPGFLENVQARGAQLQSGLRAIDRNGVFSDVRGLGLMVGAECESTEVAGKIVAAAREKKLLINTAGGNTLRFVPPLVVTEKHVSEALEILDDVLSHI